jgi:AcrR family transcriptional regulator
MSTAKGGFVTKGTERAWRLAPGLERLWDEQDGGPRRASLNIRDIVAMAMEMADENGIEDVTMARLARRLGFSTMALYRHVPNKSTLVTLMVDAGVGGPPADFRQAPGWRAQMEVLARGISAGYRIHPWLLDVPISGPPATPNNMRWLDAGLVALRDTPLEIGERISMWVLLAIFVRSQEQLFLELGRGAQAAGDRDADAHAYAEVLRRFADPALYPGLAEAIEANVFADVSTSEAENDSEFEFGLQRLLDGIQVYIDAGASRINNATS